MADKFTRKLSEVDDTVDFLVESNTGICEELDVYGCDIEDHEARIDMLEDTVAYLEGVIERIGAACS